MQPHLQITMKTVLLLLISVVLTAAQQGQKGQKGEPGQVSYKSCQAVANERKGIVRILSGTSNYIKIFQGCGSYSHGMLFVSRCCGSLNIFITIIPCIPLSPYITYK